MNLMTMWITEAHGLLLRDSCFVFRRTPKWGIGPFHSYVTVLLKGKFTGPNEGLKVEIGLDSEGQQTN